MQIGPLNISFQKEPAFPEKDIPDPEGILFQEVTRSDSSLFDKYQYQPYNPDELFQKKGNYDIYDEARADDQISAVLTLKKLLILDSEWSVDVEGGSESTQEEVKEFFEFNLKEGLPEVFERKLFEILVAMDYGFSMTERIFGMDGGKIFLKDLKTRAPHGFEFDQDKHGNITEIRQDGAEGLFPVDPVKFIHYIHNGEFQNPYGQSEINLGVYTAWWSKGAIRKFWNIYLERFGMPTVMGSYPQAMVQHKDILKKILKNIQAKTSIVKPDEFIVELLQQTGKGGETDFQKAINHYNMTIARKMLVPDLVGFGGDEISGGSYALGKEHFGIFYTVIEQERRRLEAQINKSIIKPLTFWNWGNSVTAKFNFHLVDEYRKEKDLNLWLQAVNGGKIPITDTHINWFLNQVDSPEIEQEELDRINAEKEEMRNVMMEGSNDKNSNKQVEDDKGNNPADDRRDSPGLNKSDNEKKEKGGQAKKREFRKKAKTNFKKIERDTDALQEKYVPILQGNFRIVINGLLDDIKRKRIIENKKFEAINKLSLRNMGIVNNTMKKLYRESYELGKESVAVRKDFAIGDITELNNDEVVEMFINKAFWITGNEDAEILSKVQGILINGIADGAGINEIETMLLDELEPWVARARAEAPHRVETIIRTNVFDAFNKGRQQQMQGMGEFIGGYKYNAILDGRTSELCKKLDSESTGKIYTADEASNIWPPNHFNCRSIMEPVFEDEVEDETKAGFDFKGVDKNIVKEKGGFLKVAR